VYLFHGRDDATVPFAASLAAYDTLRASGGAPVSLRECSSAVPSGHTACVPEYFGYALAVMGTPH
jgi:predicted esterase